MPWVNIVLTGIAPNQPWWYLSCTSCWKRTFPDGDAYKCLRCGVRTAEPRYKIAMLVADADGANEENPVVAQFMFFGDIGQDLVGRPPMLLCWSSRAKKLCTIRDKGTYR